MSRSSTVGMHIAPARFLLFLLLFALGFALLAKGAGMPLSDSALLAFDGAALLFLLSLFPLFRKSTAAEMRRHAKENDANRVLVLALTFLLAAIIMVTVGIELVHMDTPNASTLFLILTTLIISWLFANTMFALHYAHLFYGTRKDGTVRHGLDFPGTDLKNSWPDYWDFIYFSYTLGMTFQTSDVAISEGHMRRVVTWHSFVAFLFNMGIIAFTINIIGGA